VIAASAVGLGGLTLSIVYIAPMLPLATSPHLDGWRVVIFGIPSALLIYPITGVRLVVLHISDPCADLAELAAWLRAIGDAGRSVTRAVNLRANNRPITV
jgi:hypothetical protein